MVNWDINSKEKRKTVSNFEYIEIELPKEIPSVQADDVLAKRHPEQPGDEIRMAG